MEPRRAPDDDARATAAMYTRRRLLVGATVVGVPLGIVAVLRGGGGSDPVTDAGGDPTSTSSTGSLPPVTDSAEESTDDVSVATDPDPTPPLRQPLALGMANDDVDILQQRLADLSFAPGPVDGWFGEATLRAVWAFEKLVLGTPRESMTGIVTDEVWERLHRDVTINPRRSTNRRADHTEIYLPEQVVIVFHRDEAVLVTHMSSGALDADGEPAEWCGQTRIDIDERGYPLDEPIMREVCGRSKTPGGVFTYDRRVEGIRHGALGSMWDPVYFNYGIAVHGSPDVPARPASRGCVRIPMHISERFFGLVSIGDRVLVWDGRTQPEQLSEREMLPVFDYPDPAATTTTSTTTTTTTPPTTTTEPTAATSTPSSSTTAPPTTAPPTTAPSTTAPDATVPTTLATPSDV